jgi:hypothetical protein
MQKFTTGPYIDNGDGVWITHPVYSNQGLFMQFMNLCRKLEINRSELPYPTEADTINNHPNPDEVFQQFFDALNSDPRTKDGYWWGWSTMESGVFGYWVKEDE